MSLKNLSVIRQIGTGAFSTVYLVRRSDDEELYALKRVKLSKLSQKEKENSLNEIRILASLSSPDSRIVQYKEAFFEKNELCMVMEYAEGGDLYAQIKKHQSHETKFSEYEVWKLIVQIT